MFGLNPLDRSVAIAEIVLLLALAALIGWLIGWWLSSARVRSLRQSIADAKGRRPGPVFASEPGAYPGPVQSPAPDEVTAPVVQPVVEVPPLGAPIPETPPEAPVPVIPAPGASTPDVDAPVRSVDRNAGMPPVVVPADALGANRPDNSEAAVLNRIAARVHEINFDRIGRATAADADDLKDIVGVGPFLERKLHSLGIYTFRQVANFTPEDSHQVNELIEFFPGRIERDDWVGQARQLHERKHGARTGGA